MNERESREHKRLPHTSLLFATQSLARASPTKAPATLGNAGYWQDLQCRPTYDLRFELEKFRLNISRCKNLDVAASNLDVIINLVVNSYLSSRLILFLYLLLHVPYFIFCHLSLCN